MTAESMFAGYRQRDWQVLMSVATFKAKVS